MKIRAPDCKITLALLKELYPDVTYSKQQITSFSYNLATIDNRDDLLFLYSRYMSYHEMKEYQANLSISSETAQFLALHPEINSNIRAELASKSCAITTDQAQEINYMFDRDQSLVIHALKKGVSLYDLSFWSYYNNKKVNVINYDTLRAMVSLQIDSARTTDIDRKLTPYLYKTILPSRHQIPTAKSLKLLKILFRDMKDTVRCFRADTFKHYFKETNEVVTDPTRYDKEDIELRHLESEDKRFKTIVGLIVSGKIDRTLYERLFDYGMSEKKIWYLICQIRKGNTVLHLCKPHLSYNYIRNPRTPEKEISCYQIYKYFKDHTTVVNRSRRSCESIPKSILHLWDLAISARFTTSKGMERIEGSVLSHMFSSDSSVERVTKSLELALWTMIEKR